jgi:hypothetical protein
MLYKRILALEEENKKMKINNDFNQKFDKLKKNKRKPLLEKLNELSIDWDKFKDVDRIRIFKGYDRLIRLNNHCRTSKFHLDTNTTPKKLNLFNFPSPHFKDDENYVQNYFEIIRDCQSKLMKLFEATCNQKADQIVTEINEYKEQLSNIDRDVNDLFEKVNGFAERNIKHKLDASFEKAKRVPKHIFTFDFYNHSIRERSYKNLNFKRANGLNETLASDSSYGVSNRNTDLDNSATSDSSSAPRSILKNGNNYYNKTNRHQHYRRQAQRDNSWNNGRDSSTGRRARFEDVRTNDQQRNYFRKDRPNRSRR